MTAPTFTTTRVHDDDASFWNICCDACPFEGFAYFPDEIESIEGEHIDDEHPEDDA